MQRVYKVSYKCDNEILIHTVVASSKDEALVTACRTIAISASDVVGVK